MRITMRGSLLRSSSCICLVLFGVSQCLAQTPATTRSLVRVSQIKPDMLSEWLTIQKNEVIPALKKAGVASRTLLENVIGNRYEYRSVTPLDQYSALDGDRPLIKALGKDAGGRLEAKLAKCLDSQYTYVSTRVEELSSLPKAPVTIWVSIRFRPAPGKARDYEDYLKTDLMPVYAKAKAAGKIAGYSVSRRGFGQGTGDRLIIVYLNKAADLEAGSPVTQVLGQEGAAKLNAKSVGMVTGVESMVRRRVADLSY